MTGRGPVPAAATDRIETGGNVTEPVTLQIFSDYV